MSNVSGSPRASHSFISHTPEVANPLTSVESAAAQVSHTVLNGPADGLVLPGDLLMTIRYPEADQDMRPDFVPASRRRLPEHGEDRRCHGLAAALCSICIGVVVVGTAGLILTTRS